MRMISCPRIDVSFCGDANPRRLERQQMLWMTSHCVPTVVRSVTEIPFHVFICKWGWYIFHRELYSLTPAAFPPQ